MLGAIFSPIPLYRVSRWFYIHKLPFIAYLIFAFNYFLTSCSIPASCSIGKRTKFPDFGSGVVINGNTTIGDDCIFLPGAVLGQNVISSQNVVELESIRVGNRVTVGAGAKIIASGYLEIGDDVTIGANAVVLHSVSAGQTVAGVPAKVIKTKPVN